MLTEHYHPTIGNRALRHRWAGGALPPIREPSSQPEVRPEGLGNEALWAFDHNRLTLGLSKGEKRPRKRQAARLVTKGPNRGR
jgi:hypothetical protein